MRTRILVPARVAAQVREYRALKERSHELAIKQRDEARKFSEAQMTSAPCVSLPEFVEQLRAMIDEREAVDNLAARKFNALRNEGVYPELDNVFTTDPREGA